MSNSPQTPDFTKDIRPLKGKYDPRGGSRINSGRKPDWVKHLARNSAAYVLKEVGIKERALSFLEATQWVSAGKNQPAVEVPDVRLQWEVFKYLWDRLEGRPFVQTDPALLAKPSVVNNDNRLQIAIQQLIPGAKAKAPKKIKAQVVESAQLPESTE